MTTEYTLAIVDDCQEKLNYLRTQLDNHFNNTVHIKVFTNPVVAVQQFIDPNGFDMILLDCHMPSMDGKEVYTKLRLSGKKTPIAFFSTEEDMLKEVQGIPDTKSFILDLDNPYSIQRIAEYSLKKMEEYLFKNNLMRLHERMDKVEKVQARGFAKIFASLDSINTKMDKSHREFTTHREECISRHAPDNEVKTGWGKFGQGIAKFFEDPVTKIFGVVIVGIFVYILPKIYTILAATGGKVK